MKPQDKTPVDREGVRLLAIELGASAAARKLGLSPNTVRSWAKRYNWNLPARAGRPAIVPATDLQRPGDILLQEHKALEETGKTALLQTVAKAAKLAAGKPAFDVSTTAQLRDLALTMAKLCGWDGKAQPSVTVNADKAVIVCDEGRRAELIAQRQRLIAQRQRLLEAEKPVPGRTVDVLTAASQETQSKANVSAGNDAVAQNQNPAAQQNPFYRHMAAIGKGESLRTGKGSEQWNE